VAEIGDRAWSQESGYFRRKKFEIFNNFY
jgi:hypothetical protein